MGSVAIPGPSRLSDDERHQLEQYKKIMALRDEVLSGNHPRIKIPDRLVGKVPPPNAFPSPVLLSTRPSISDSTPVMSVVPSNGGSTPSIAPAITSASAPTSTSVNKSGIEINPVFLQKSDHLIRAELQIQRQRIEASLKEELETKRQAYKASIYPEPDLNITTIYEQAQRLVAVADGTANAPATANPVADVDSHSDGTFYSSRHSTPEPQDEDDQPMSIDDAASVGEPSKPAPTIMTSAAATVNLSTAVPTPMSQSTTLDSTVAQPPTVYSNFPPSYPPSPSLSVQPLGFESQNFLLHATAGLSTGSSSQNDVEYLGVSASTRFHSPEGNSTDSPASGRMDIDHISASVQQPTQPQYTRARRNYGDLHPASPPVIRSHNLVPATPQPYHVSPLAQNGAASVEASVPQQALSPQADATASSAEASPHDVGRRKQQQKSKKRKQDRTDDVVVKTEPRSPEPMKGSTYAPRKRQRAKRGNALIDDDNIPYSPSRPLGTESRPRERRPAVDPYASFDSQDPYGPQEPMYVEAAPHPRAPQFVRPSYVTYGDEYGAPERQVTRYYHDVPESEYATSPTVIEREPGSMGPPRAPGTLVMVDAYGRPYYEPHRGGTRPQPASALHPEEVVYERPARRPPPPLEYYHDSAVYHRPSPQYAVAPRRVVTQHDLREDTIHRREYSARPTEDYVPVRAAPVERRVYEEAPSYARPVGVRPMSVRPMEVARYEMPPVGYQRVASVRPDASGEIQQPPAPTPRHFMPPPVRAYSVVPAERPQRSYSAVHAGPDIYYEDLGYIERYPGHAAPTEGIIYGEETYRR